MSEDNGVEIRVRPTKVSVFEMYSQTPREKWTGRLLWLAWWSVIVGAAIYFIP